METLLSDSHLGPHTKLKVYRKRRATRPTLEKQSVSSFVHFNGIACIFINRKIKRRSSIYERIHKPEIRLTKWEVPLEVPLKG